VRALILALARFEITSKDETRTLEKEWIAYRKQYQLDVEGRATARAWKAANIEDRVQESPLKLE
jgi:hypothetical protein